MRDRRDVFRVRKCRRVYDRAHDRFSFHVEYEMHTEPTPRSWLWLKRLVSASMNLFNPASVKDVLTEKLKDKTVERKYNLVKAYKAFMTAYGMDAKTAALPKYKPGRKLPYLPPEAHMDQLIASAVMR